MLWASRGARLPAILVTVALTSLHSVAQEHAGATGAEGGHEGASHLERKYPLTENAPLQLRCSATAGDWCQKALKQEPIPWRTAPRGSKDCSPADCNNAGRCNYDTGLCECTAGWTGSDCATPQKRPCTNKQRTIADPRKEPTSFIGPDKRDWDWTNMAKVYSRCGGVCDDDVAICYCDGPMGRIPAPEGSPPGTPPIRRGRPLVTFHMAPTTTWDKKPAFGEHEYHLVYGPQGYCNVTEPIWMPNCGLDDLAGQNCDEPLEPFCPGACSGHGRCNLGFCFCDDGYYGHDCSRRKAGLPLLPSRIPTTPWLASVVREPPAALEPPPRATRRRPLVYVYDLEPLFQARLLQYRISPPWCVHRRHDLPGNHTVWSDMWVYAADGMLHESLLLSEHRTFDPEEADFFFVPHQASCLPCPIGSWVASPWFRGPGGPRPRQMANMLMDTVEWINATHPFWQRRGGRDHVFLFTHDEGACWAPNVLNNSIWLTHWGRMGLDHKSQTAFWQDIYDMEAKSPHQPEGWLVHTKGHACYNPEKDLVIPAFKQPKHYIHSPLLGAPSKPRDLFFYFRGDVGKHRQPGYSRGVRQKIYQLAKAGKWHEEHKFFIGGNDDEHVHGDYSEMLSRATFCLVTGGDGWSARLEDAVLHGCIPVIIFDRVHAVFESILDLDSFSVRIAEADVEKILDILKALPERK
ncbi:hypothetical protein HYH03_019181 [Edaphochlamys debaryana]|uniref:EGF-like domain-containing protein n=1 Tax=Edaphochlamys debaryana TaxID=47281 RepID=A0A836BML4_9CHLO|nr:hypothetical protein HYH03_019181 [Edaphochlamys debaryana]|eukprot:KAG2481857.1 hypothetical protein HYH03_019181 [Edaphochlamys debaryana]